MLPGKLQPGILVLLAACPIAPVRAEEPRRTTLYIQPLGSELPEEDVKLVVIALKAFYALPVKIMDRANLPEAAFYGPRRRYRAERLLAFIEEKLPADGIRILGLTGVDISTTKGKVKDWGVLGLATLDGRACVISSFRARMRARGARHARERLAKVAVHEIGHTLGLPHCPVRGCLMEDARGRVGTCDREYDICQRCRALLKEQGVSIPESPRIPWLAP